MDTEDKSKWEELKNIAKKFKIDKYPVHADNACPNCGYCPHCGRQNNPPQFVPVYPSYPNSFPPNPWGGQTWISTSGNMQGNANSGLVTWN